MAAPGGVDADRGLSEATAIGILLGSTVLVTAAVGASVLIEAEMGSGGPPSANFSYQYFSDHRMLLVTHAEGDAIPAGDILFVGPGGEVTWAELAAENESTLIGVGNTTQLSDGSAYGAPVDANDRIVIYLSRNGNRTRLDVWSEGEGTVPAVSRPDLPDANGPRARLAARRAAFAAP